MPRASAKIVRLFAMCCAVLLGPTAPRAAAQDTPPRTVISLPGHAAPLLLDTIGVWREVDTTPERAFAALTIIYDQLKIPVGVRDSRRRYIGNLHFTKMRSLGKSSLSEYIECGNDMTGSRADKYRVHFAVVSRIDSLGPGRSRIRSAVVAGAEDVLGSSVYPIPCGTTGRLESKITNFVVASAKSP